MPSEKWVGKVLAFGKRLVAGHMRVQELRRLPLEQRHRDIVERAEQSMRLDDSQRHYVDDLTAQCLRDIASKEGRSDAAPVAGQWLWKWQKRTGIPQEYLELAQYLQGRFQNRYAELRQAHFEADDHAKERRYEQYREWFSQNRSIVDRFLEVADRKVSLLDDYGDEKWDALPKEIQTCLLKFAKTENDDAATENKIKDALKNGYDWMVPEKYQWLKAQLESEFRKFHEKRICSPAEPMFDDLSGTEFETYLARLLKRNGLQTKFSQKPRVPIGCSRVIRRRLR